MAELKTKPTGQDVEAFLNAVPEENRRQDCIAVLEMMKQASGAEPKMWGDSIVGFGQYHYKGASGREGDWFKVGFSPRKQNLTLYIPGGIEPHQGLLKKLGKHSTGKGCLYVKRLSDIDANVLKQLMTEALKTKSNG